jgi:hypothetical protein
VFLILNVGGLELQNQPAEDRQSTQILAISQTATSETHEIRKRHIVCSDSGYDGEQACLCYRKKPPNPSKGEIVMSFDEKLSEGETRREFIRNMTAGAAGLAAADSVGAVEASAIQNSREQKETKYGKWIKPFIFQEWHGPYRYYTKHISEFPNLTIEYGTPAVAGRIGPDSPEIHDFNQVMVFMGSDMLNVTDLHAEIEFCMGSEKERHLICSSTPVLIPKGIPHLPATVNRMDRQIIVMTISQTSDVRSTPAPASKEVSSVMTSGFSTSRSKYASSYPTLLWARKGRGWYGTLNPDDAGGLRCEHTWSQPFPFRYLPEKLYI